MSIRSSVALVFTAAAALVLFGCANNEMWGRHGDDDEGKEQQVNMDQIPAPVKATLTKEAGGGQIQEVEKMTWRGRTAYEADVMADGKKWEVTVREDGQLLRKMLDEEDDAEDDKNDKDEKNDKDD
jgi:hypothetical protein